MKGLVKDGVRAVWRWISPLRRPLMRKLDGALDRCVNRCLEPTQQLWAAERLRGDELNMVMNYVVRELIHLQRQVDALQQSVDDLADSSRHPAIAEETERADGASRKAG